MDGLMGWVVTLSESSVSASVQQMPEVALKHWGGGGGLLEARNKPGIAPLFSKSVAHAHH